MKEISFKNLSVGPYSEDVLKKHWNIASGKGMEFCEIVSLEGENVLQINYPKGEVGKGPLWNYKFEKPVDEYMLEYKVRVPNDFDFVRGGKLPGLYGGSGPAGGASVAEADGFSARIMWRELGVLCQYVYYMDKDPESHWGKNYLWMKGLNKNMPITRDMWKTMNEYFNDRVYIVPGKWHTLKTYIKMNTLGKEDGKIVSWCDGEEVVNVNLRFRNDLSFGIDRFKFTTFFGGNEETWAPTKDEKMYFKDFRLHSEKF